MSSKEGCKVRSSLMYLVFHLISYIGALWNFTVVIEAACLFLSAVSKEIHSPAAINNLNKPLQACIGNREK